VNRSPWACRRACPNGHRATTSLSWASRGAQPERGWDLSRFIPPPRNFPATPPSMRYTCCSNTHGADLASTWVAKQR